MTQLTADGALSSPAPRRQTAHILAEIGQDAYVQGGSAGAEFMWSRALEIDPASLDSSFLLGMSRAFTHRDFPEAAEAAYAPLLDHVADRPLAPIACPSWAIFISSRDEGRPLESGTPCRARPSACRR